MSASAIAERLDVAAVAELVLAASAAREPLVTITVVDGPQSGARAVLRADELVGTLGDAALDARARAHAQEALAANEPALREGVFYEPITHAAPLLIVGAGHIAVPLADLAVRLGFAVTVLDDREEFATSERFTERARVITCDFDRPFAQLAIDHHTFVVLVTRAHKYDYDCLRLLLELPEPPRYIGMIGSRRRVRAAFLALAQAGVTHERIARVKAPVGLDIGAETPVEIAVSIAAELIRERSGRGSGGALSEQEQVLQRFFPTPDAND